MILRSRRANRLDRVGSRAQLVSRHMTHRPSLSGGVSRFLGSAEHLSCRGVGGKGGLASFGPCNLATCPRACLFNGQAWTVISGAYILKEVQNVFRTISGP